MLTLGAHSSAHEGLNNIYVCIITEYIYRLIGYEIALTVSFLPDDTFVDKKMLFISNMQAS